ncbi:sphingosine-1-phosphate phosphatase 1, partial [Eurytemora carolleeae]|uniref:sphingosine-1-phosphate phosphatase 1 n=1 Tax=Eurytemora carolleeae TaxID=1294199 RepID=UPI000C773B6A
MPSTHAIVGFVVPGSVIIFTMYRYIYPFSLLLAASIVWCILVCSSRIYLGMHSIGDIIAGLALSATLLPLFAPLADAVDNYLLTSAYSPFVTTGLSILAIVLYPGRDRWTPAWGDTTLIVGAHLGQHLGNWLNFQMGLLVAANIPAPYPILWPTWASFGLTIFRVVIGGVIGVATRAVFKPLAFIIACYILKEPNLLENKGGGKGEGQK